MCPLTFKEMLGSVPFVCISACGCVFSQAGLNTVSQADNGSPKDETKGDSDGGSPADSEKQYQLCPSCGTKYDKSQDVLTLNPSPEEEAIMHVNMLKRRAAEPTKTKGQKRKVAVDADQPSTKKRATVNSSNAGISSATRAVTASLAEEETRRKANMSDAVKSLYASKDGPKRKETFMTMGTFTRVGYVLPPSSIALLNRLPIVCLSNGRTVMSTQFLRGCCALILQLWMYTIASALYTSNLFVIFWTTLKATSPSDFGSYGRVRPQQ